MGLTKVFMKESVKVMLDELLEKSAEAFAIRIQKHIRRFIARRRFLRIVKAVRIIQGRLKNLMSILRIKKRAKERCKREKYPALMITRSIRNYLIKKHLLEGLRKF